MNRHGILFDSHAVFINIHKLIEERENIGWFFEITPIPKMRIDNIEGKYVPGGNSNGINATMFHTVNE